MPKIKIPKKIKLGSSYYRISLQKNLKLMDGVWGDLGYLRHRIDIDASLPNRDKAITLVHEFLHAIDREYSCSLDEKEVDRISNGFTALLLDNLGIEFDWSGIDG